MQRPLLVVCGGWDSRRYSDRRRRRGVSRRVLSGGVRRNSRFDGRREGLGGLEVCKYGVRIRRGGGGRCVRAEYSSLFLAKSEEVVLGSPSVGEDDTVGELDALDDGARYDLALGCHEEENLALCELSGRERGR
jgi:hypothetical protein